MAMMSGAWEKSHHTEFTLWDIDREFQNAYENYEQWQAKNQRKRSMWECFGGRKQEDALARALRLGRSVQKMLESGRDAFGTKFERGDSICHTILSAQLQRCQHEITVPLLDCALARVPIELPYDDLLTAAKAIRRACLYALRDQYARLQTMDFAPILPPPKFSVDYCPFALQLQKSHRKGLTITFDARKVRPFDDHDEREICPHCEAQISVSAHTGLPEYRRLLFASHIACNSRTADARASFACNSCYKEFDDSYAFLDHVFQKDIGSDRSCLKRKQHSDGHLSVTEIAVESDPKLVETCLHNCMQREMKRMRSMQEKGEWYQ